MYTPHKRVFDLADYPHEIAKLRSAIARLDNQITDLSTQLETIEAEIDACVAFDADLKNDQQRRAKRAQLKADHPTHTDLTANLRHIEQERLKLDIKLNLTRDLFSVAKLQKRHEIATLMTADLLSLDACA